MAAALTEFRRNISVGWFSLFAIKIHDIPLVDPELVDSAILYSLFALFYATAVAYYQMNNDDHKINLNSLRDNE